MCVAPAVRRTAPASPTSQCGPSHSYSSSAAHRSPYDTPARDKNTLFKGPKQRKLVTWSKGVPIGSTGIFPGGSHQVIPTESGLKNLTSVSLFQVLTLAAIHRTSTFFLFLASMLRSREDNKSASDWIPADRRRRKFSSVIVSLLAIRQPSVSKQLARVGRKAPFNRKKPQ